jgi:Tfp pilus assembly protein PilO
VSRFELPLFWLKWVLHALASAIALLVVGAGWEAGRWLSACTEQTAALRDEAQNCLERTVEIQQKDQTLRANLTAAKQEAEALENRLTEGPQESQFVAQLAELSKQTGLEIKSFRPGAKAAHGALGKLEVRLSCTGTYESLCSFLAELSALPRLCHVSGLDVSPIDEAATSVGAEFQIHVLFRNPVKQAEPRRENDHAI